MPRKQLQIRIGRRRQARASRHGAALVTVLGVLAVLTILAVSVALVMRLESTGAHRYADRIRALHYTEVGLIHAIQALDEAMATNRFAYPYWAASPPAGWGHAFATFSTNRSPYLSDFINLFEGYVTNLIPISLHGEMANVTSSWLYVLGQDPTSDAIISTNGRVAYLAVNLSGLLDIHAIRSTSDTVRATDAGVFDLDTIPELGDTGYQDALLHNRDERHLHYETYAEFVRFNDDWMPTPASNLFIYSYDPNPHVYMTDTNAFGTRGAEIEPRFNLNAITNYYDAGFTGDEFMSEYFNPLVAHLTEAGVTNARETAWNVVAMLEPGHLPVNGHRSIGIQAVPLINEIGLEQAPPGTHPETHLAYRFKVELWFPFVPREITEADDYWLHVYVFPEFYDKSVFSLVSPSFSSPNWSFRVPVGAMAYGGPDEFKVFESPDDKLITFPVRIMDFLGNETTQYLPIGGPHTYRPASGAAFVSTNNAVWFLARVTEGEAHTNVVNEAMGHDPGAEPGDSRAVKMFDGLETYAVVDPRVNHRTEFWIADTPSFGSRNPATDRAMTNGAQGLPIVHLNGPASSIVDIGQAHVYEQPWQTIDLLDAGRGALLLDRLTLTPTNDAPWQSGRVNLNSQHPYVLRSLFTLDRIPQPDAGGTTNIIPVTSEQLDDVALAIATNALWPYRLMADMFRGTNAGPVAAAMRALGDATNPTSFQQQYALRYLVDKTTTRENLLGIILAGQSLSPDGRRITSEYREFVLVMRDAWTGNWFVKQRFVLDDW